MKTKLALAAAARPDSGRIGTMVTSASLSWAVAIMRCR